MLMAGAVNAHRLICRIAYSELLQMTHNIHTTRCMPRPRPRFKLDEGVLFKGSALHASLAVEFLRSRQQQQAAKAAAGSSGKEEL